jgi:hypothetical protein
MAKLTYFDKHRGFGELDDLVIIDTSQFTETDWFELQCVENVQESVQQIARARDLPIYILSYIGRI